MTSVVTARLNLLVVEPRNLFPRDAGARILSGNVLAHLTRHHNVTVIVNIDPADFPIHLDELRGICTDVIPVAWKERKNFTLRFCLELLRCLCTGRIYGIEKFCTPTLKGTVRRLVSGKKFDAVLFDTLWAAMPDVLLKDAAAVIIAHNIEYLLRERQADRAGHGPKAAYLRHYARKTMEFEIDAYRKADQVVTVSRADADYVRNTLGISHVSALPPGVDAEYFSPREPESPDPHLVFTGSMDWQANQDAVAFFVGEVLPRIRKAVPNVCFTVVGRRPPAHIRALASADPDHVVVTGTVDDVRPYLARAQVVVVPVLFGSGIKIKVFEAMAMAKPVVVSTIGAEGLPLTHGENAVIADTAEDMAARCVELLRDPGKRRRLGERARATVLNGHDWSVVAAELARICEEVVARRREPH